MILVTGASRGMPGEWRYLSQAEHASPLGPWSPPHRLARGERAGRLGLNVALCGGRVCHLTTRIRGGWGRAFIQRALQPA
jgi:hypothetical protein